MSKSLVVCFAFLAALSGIAWFWHPGKTHQSKTPLVWVSDNNPTRAAQIDQFNRENPSLQLNLDYANGGMQKIILQCSSGIGPDLFDFSDQDLQTYAEAGVLWDVSDFAEKMNFSATRNGWPGGGEAGLYLGRQYGYFSNIGASILIYNKNIFDYYGVPYPNDSMTWNDLVAVAAKVNTPTAARDGNRQIYAFTGVTWRNYFESLRGELFTEDGLLDLRSDKLETAVQWHKDILFKYKLMPTTLEMKTMSGHGGWGTGNLNAFASGDFAMIMVGDYALVAFRQAYLHQVAHPVTSTDGEHEDFLSRPLRLGATLIPHAEGMPPCYRISARITGINPQSPHRDDALKLLQYMAGPSYSSLINSGMDWLPGNPKHTDLGLQDEYPDLSRLQMHRATTTAMSYGYVPRESPFLLTSDVNRVLQAQISRMETDPNLEVRELLDAAEDELMALLRRNLDRQPELKKLYEARIAHSELGSGTENAVR